MRRVHVGISGDGDFSSRLIRPEHRAVVQLGRSLVASFAVSVLIIGFWFTSLLREVRSGWETLGSIGYFRSLVVSILVLGFSSIIGRSEVRSGRAQIGSIRKLESLVSRFAVSIFASGLFFHQSQRGAQRCGAS